MERSRWLSRRCWPRPPVRPILTKSKALQNLGTASIHWAAEPRGFSELGVGILATGFLPRWADFLGHDISTYPKAKPKSEDDVTKLPLNTFCTLRALLSAIPEIADLFAEVFDSEPSWIMPVPDGDANQRPSFRHRSELKSTYIKLIDRSGKITQARIEDAKWPIAELSRIPDASTGQIFRARVDHPESDHWFDALPLHQSPFENSGALILPPLSEFDEYRVIAMAVLYALSILVRYMPLTWRRVEGGDLDQHLALVKTALGVFERILPQEFLEVITGERIVAAQPGSFWG